MAARAVVSQTVMVPNFENKIKEMPFVKAHLRSKAEEIVQLAQNFFNRQVKHTKPVTPPPYADSFYITPSGFGFIIGNSDPIAFLVEFGTHPGGGSTFTLNYRPLGKAIDAMASRR